MARCPACSEIVPEGCNCASEDTFCLDWSGDGSELTPYTLVPDLSADVDQLLSCTSSGLKAILPTTISNPPSTQAFHESQQLITNNTMTTVALNNETWDTDTMHNPSSNNSRVTFTTAGYYLVSFQCSWDKNATGDRIAQVRKNGTTVLVQETKRTGGADLYVAHSFCITILVIATDYVEARVQQTSGVSLYLKDGTGSPVLAAQRVA